MTSIQQVIYKCFRDAREQSEWRQACAQVELRPGQGQCPGWPVLASYTHRKLAPGAGDSWLRASFLL